MDASRFDNLARRPASRRNAVRALTAATVATLQGRGSVAAGTHCVGWGSPWINDRRFTDGTVCCNGICKASGDCGGSCAAYGGCGRTYNGAPGDPGDISDPWGCGIGLGCCPIRGWDVNSGVCSDACYPE